MISAISRYVTASVQRITDTNGVTRSTIILADPSSRLIQYTEYRVVDGDEISTLAASNLGDPRLWWQIADANPEIISWSTLVPGTIIRVPIRA